MKKYYLLMKLDVICNNLIYLLVQTFIKSVIIFVNVNVNTINANGLTLQVMSVKCSSNKFNLIFIPVQNFIIIGAITTSYEVV